MTGHRAVFPPGSDQGSVDLKLSPAVVSGDHVFVTGMTGSGPDGAMPSDPAIQFRAAFDKIDKVLQAAGSAWSNAVDVTSFHIGLDEHFEAFKGVYDAYVKAPFPAWTAVEVAGLRRPGALVEIRVVARLAQIEAP